jgi:RNA-directed DNA polymerase
MTSKVIAKELGAINQEKQTSSSLGSNGVGRTETIQYEEITECLASNTVKTPTCMELVVSNKNWLLALKKVKANRGCGGVDGITLKNFETYLQEHESAIKESLVQGSYNPKEILGVKIPKPNGGTRELGIPTIIDRVIQQAILQVIEPEFEKEFSNSSYGFRPKRSCHMALQKAAEYVRDDRVWVVDIDLESFFDRINHDLVMARISKKITDKRVLKLIRLYLQADILSDGVKIQRQEGAPQGGPLSALLANIMLDDLDKELERRNHKFCRYADDCNVYVRSQKAGNRVFESIKRFINKKLKLKINDTKSGVKIAKEVKFLGYNINNSGELKVDQKSIARLKQDVKSITQRNRGVKLEKVIEDLNRKTVGWINYYRLSKFKTLFIELDSWIRRKLRCYRLKQRKRTYPIAQWLIQLGIKAKEAWLLAKSSKGWWRLSKTPQLNAALTNRWFIDQGLRSLYETWQGVRAKTAVCEIACTVV